MTVYDSQLYAAPKSVAIEVHRWDVLVTIEEQDGTKHQFVASADSGFTQSDGIWWSTKEVYDQGPIL